MKNTFLKYSKGAILTITSPGGGKLRDKLIELVKENDLDNLLNVDLIRNLKKEINIDLEEGKAIYRITQTDFSQEKAIIGSLKDSSIIWGPPGTGKSQTITNIIANLLANQEKAIITSEKKAALDVIQNRLGKLSKYVFFGLVDKNVDKESFYAPFRNLLNAIIEVENNIMFSNPTTLLTNIEWKYFKAKEILKDESIDNLIDIKKNHSWILSSSLINNIHNNFKFIINNRKYINQLDENNSFDEILFRSGIKKKGFIFKKYPSDIRKTMKISRKLNNNDLLKKLSKINDLNNLRNIDYFLDIEKRYKHDRNVFWSDENFLDKLLAIRFRDKIAKLRNSDLSKKTITFLKNISSGYRIPYKFVNVHKKIIENLFDIFISTPKTLSNIIDMNFQYDYAIFDEASQLHLEKAIPFVSIAKKSIIAGDDKQMRPTSWMKVRDNTELIGDEEVNTNSLLDYAFRCGLDARKYMLTKNYRSKSADLMMFSSKEFYDSKLDTLDSKDFIGKESIEVYDSRGKWESRINDKEARDVLDKLLEVKGFFQKIIILTFNSTQKQYINSLIYEEEKYKEIIELFFDGKVFLRNLENIQGDEANLVIVSVAYDKNASFGSTYVARPEGKNALNVAISRAIEKMIVFKSVSFSEIQGNDKNDSIRVFKEWLSYLDKTKNEKQEYLLSTNRALEQFDSTFEEDVYDFMKENIIITKQVEMRTQFTIGTYRIDLAFIDEKNQFLLGVEIDGYKYHSGFEKMTKDIERQRFIEAKGYKPIYRLTELNWKLDRFKELERIKKLLDM